MPVAAVLVLTFVRAFAAPASTAVDPRLDQAAELQRHSLLSQATELYIAALYSPKEADPDRAECLYHLGEMSFEQGQANVALDDWSRLVQRYPESPRAVEVKDRLAQMGSLQSKEAESTTHDAIADIYLKNGDFWSPSDRVYHLDSSFLDVVAMSDEWYDRVIKEFPGSPAAALAHERKILNEVGGQSRKGNLVCGDPTKAAKLFAEMVQDTPQAPSLQRLRFLIGQSFWYRHDYADAHAWLDQLTQVGAKADDFYVRLARARLAGIPKTNTNATPNVLCQ